MSCNYIILTLFRFSQIYTYDYLIHMMKMYVQVLHRTHELRTSARTHCADVPYMFQDRTYMFFGSLYGIPLEF